MIYKFIDISNHSLISDKVYKYILTKTRILESNVVWNWAFRWGMLEDIPELKHALEQLNLEASRIAIINSQPKSIGNIHIDYDTTPRILWPIKNCAGSYTKFYEVDRDNIIDHRGPNGDKSFHIKDTSLARHIDTVELTSPIMFKPWVAHNIVTNPEYNESRITMTIQFKNSIDHVFPKD
jgi:hypothetical protein